MEEGEGNANKSLMHQNRERNEKNFVWMKNHTINEEVEGELESKPRIMV